MVGLSLIKFKYCLNDITLNNYHLICKIPIIDSNMHTMIAPTHKGENTHTQDQFIAPNILRSIKTKVKSGANPIFAFINQSFS
jgi:hypothetical protein